MANLGLADAVDAAETLFEAIGVPRKVVVEEQVGALEVDAFAGRVGRQQHPGVRIVNEGLLCAAAVFTTDPPVDGDHALGPDEHAHPRLKVVEGVAVLREDDQLPSVAVAVAHFLLILQERRKLFPLAILAEAADLRGQRFETLQRVDLGSQLADCLRRGRLVDHLLLDRDGLVLRDVVEVVEVQAPASFSVREWRTAERLLLGDRRSRRSRRRWSER